jgi:hypothetical protein
LVVAAVEVVVVVVVLVVMMVVIAVVLAPAFSQLCFIVFCLWFYMGVKHGL